MTLSTAWTPPNATRMLRISTSGCASPAAVATGRVDDGRGGRRVTGDLGFVTARVASGSPTASAPAGGSVSRPTAATRTMPTTMSWIGESTLQQDHARLERLHDDGAEDGARDRPDAARERRAADDRRRDDVQLALRAEADGRRVEAGRRGPRRDSAARMPMITNVLMIVRRVLMPASSAASGLPPIE